MVNSGRKLQKKKITIEILNFICATWARIHFLTMYIRIFKLHKEIVSHMEFQLISCTAPGLITLESLYNWVFWLVSFNQISKGRIYRSEVQPIKASSNFAWNIQLHFLQESHSPNLTSEHKVAILHHMFVRTKITELSFYFTEQPGTPCNVDIFSQLYDNNF